jgi:diguanylate cyclase (GGDEF)-like protein/PAS domain S-box-containing protein
MSEHMISSVIIVDEKKHPIGIFTEYDALKIVAHNSPIESSLEEVMSPEPFTVSQTTYLHDAYMLLTEKGYRHIIVVNEEGEYIGIVSEGDFLRYMSLEHLSKIDMVEHMMDKTPLIVEQTAKIQEVAQLMSDTHSDYAIVMKNFKPIGIVDERAIAHHFVHTHQNPNALVDELIYSSAYFIPKSVSLHEAAQLLTKHGAHQLVVIDDENSVIGLLKRFDLLKAIHGSYFEFLISTIEKKSRALEKTLLEQKLLLEKSTLLDTVINAIPDLVWVKDIQGKYLTCNQMFERLCGASRLDIIGKDDYSFVSVELADFFRANEQYAIKEDKTVQNEEYLVFQDGSYEGTFETVTTPIKDVKSNVLGVLGISRDISERYTREEELQLRQRELRSAEELAHVGSWTLDYKTNRLRGSDETHRIFGIQDLESVSFEEVINIVHPEDRQMVSEHLFEAKNTGVYEMTNRIIVDGTIKWIASSAKLSKDESGEYVKAHGMLQDVTTQKLYEMELERLANFDTLTGLANRTYLLAHLEKLIHRNRRHKNNAAVLLFDLDHFRNINDSFGHNIGDELLVEVAHRMSECMRQEDFLAHLSGDEFVMVLEKLSHEEDVTKVVQKVIDKLAESFTLSNKIEVRIGVSVGIVLIPQEVVYENELLQYADAALFQAKKEGRNCYRFYSNELTVSVQERIRYQNEIFHALENNEFELYYQPQVHIETDRIIGVEALIRWNHPTKGIVSPTVFIPIAEESGLIAHIGEWTLFEACRQGKIWSQEGHDLHVSVNVSMQQLRHQNLIDVVNRALSESGFSADKLILELTESAMMKHEDELASMLHQLRAKGIGIAIDDFGTGYSSYSYLKRFPIDLTTSQNYNWH